MRGWDTTTLIAIYPSLTIAFAASSLPNATSGTGSSAASVVAGHIAPTDPTRSFARMTAGDDGTPDALPSRH